MQVDKSKFLSHLARLSAGGEIRDAIVEGAFRAAAVGAGEQLLVVVPEMGGVESLPEPVGIVDLGRLIRSTNLLSSEAGGEVSIEFKDARIRATQKHGGRMSLVTAAPTGIGSRIEEETLDTALKFLEGGTRVKLDKTTVDGVKEAKAVMNPEIITLRVGGKKTKTGQVFVGEEITDNAEFDLAGLVGDEAYEVAVDAKLLVTVFGMVTDYAKANLIITGPDSIIAVEENGYMWIISPKSEES